MTSNIIDFKEEVNFPFWINTLTEVLKKINLKITTKKDRHSFAVSGFFMAAHWVTNAQADPAGAAHARRSRGRSIQLKMQRILAIFEGTEEIRNIGMIDGFTRRVFHKILF